MSDLRLFVGVNAVNHDGTPLHNIAVYNEYGTETAPPRPAFRIGAEKALSTRKLMIKSAITNIARAGLMKNKKLSAKLINDREKILLTGIGQSAVKEVKNIIDKGSTQPNAPATIKKKGFDHPLYETGVLKNNISYLVSK